MENSLETKRESSRKKGLISFICQSFYCWPETIPSSKDYEIDNFGYVVSQKLIVRQFMSKTVLVSHSGSNYTKRLLIFMFPHIWSQKQASVFWKYQ